MQKKPPPKNTLNELEIATAILAIIWAAIAILNSHHTSTYIASGLLGLLFFFLAVFSPIQQILCQSQNSLIRRIFNALIKSVQNGFYGCCSAGLNEYFKLSYENTALSEFPVKAIAAGFAIGLGYYIFIILFIKPRHIFRRL